MEKVFDVVRNVSTPLALAGVISAVLLFVLLQLIKSMSSSNKLNKEQGGLYKQIITGMFILAVVGMCLGFIGYIWSSNSTPKPIPAPDPSLAKLHFNGFLLINQHPKDNVIVQELTSEEKTVTDNFGKFVFENIDTSAYDSIIFWFQASNLDTVARYGKHNIPNNFYFAENTVNIAVDTTKITPHIVDTVQPVAPIVPTPAGQVQATTTQPVTKVYPMFITRKTADNANLFRQYKARMAMPRSQRAQ